MPNGKESLNHNNHPEHVSNWSHVLIYDPSNLRLDGLVKMFEREAIHPTTGEFHELLRIASCFYNTEPRNTQLLVSDIIITSYQSAGLVAQQLSALTTDRQTGPKLLVGMDPNDERSDEIQQHLEAYQNHFVFHIHHPHRHNHKGLRDTTLTNRNFFDVLQTTSNNLSRTKAKNNPAYS